MFAKNFTSRLVTRVTFFVVFLAVLGGIWRYFFVTEIIQRGIQKVLVAEQEALASYIAGDINEKLETRRRFLEDLAANLTPEMLDNPEEMERWLGQRYAVMGAFPLGITVVPVSGKGAIVDFPPYPGRRDLDFSDYDWLQRVVGGADFVVGKPYFGRISGRELLSMAVPLRDPQGKVLAVVNGTVPMDTPGFLDLIQNRKLGKEGGYLLISPRDEMFVAASVPTMRLTHTPLPGVNVLHDKAMKGWRGSGVTVNAFGVETLVAAVSVSAVDWFVVAYLPTDEAFEPVWLLARTVFWASFGAITAAVIALVSYLIYAFKPMHAAAKRMHRMAAGLEPLAKLPIIRRDEIGEMVEGFNTLVDKLQQSEVRLTHMAHHDVLTGLPNRNLFMARLEQSVALARRRNSRLALLFIDLDDFKPVNDAFGHEAGDRMLQEVGRRLMSAVREADTVARFGGDEFVILLTDIGTARDAANVGHKLIERISTPFVDVVPGERLKIGASIGIGMFPTDSEDLNHLLAAADTAMYDAKRAGRNCLRFAGPHRPQPSPSGDGDVEGENEDLTS